MVASDFDRVVEQYHAALDEFFKGNPEPAILMYSRQNDVSLANPFGPVVRGLDEVARTARLAAKNYRDGEATGFERVSEYVTHDLICLVEVEHGRAKVGGSCDFTSLALRVTSVFRLEENVWRVVHRHADPITSPRTAESVVLK